MSRILETDQKALTKCLKILGCSFAETALIVARVWNPEEVEEMLSFIEKHQTATPAELLKLSSEIYSRHKNKPEEEPNTP